MPYKIFKIFSYCTLSTKILRESSATECCKSFTSASVSLTSELLQKVKEPQSHFEWNCLSKFPCWQPKDQSPSTTETVHTARFLEVSGVNGWLRSYKKAVYTLQIPSKALWYEQMTQRTQVKKSRMASLPACYHAASYRGARDYLSPGKKTNLTTIDLSPQLHTFSLKVEMPPQPGGWTGWLAFACA